MTESIQDAPVLVVDDKEENLYSFRKILEQSDFPIVTCSSGAAALKYLMNNQASLLLLDVQMPEINGFETARLIRQRDRFSDLPIIFITAVRNTDEFVRQGYAVGCYDYINKPVDAEVLINKVRIFRRLYLQQKALEERSDTLEQLNRVLKSNQILEQATRAKDQFLASMSHELRTPLTAILGYCDLLLSDRSGQTDTDHIESIRLAGESQLFLVNDLLDMSKIKAGKFSVVEQPFSLPKMINEVKKLLSLKAEQVNLRFDTQMNLVPKFMVLGDEQRIKQVLINLLANAIKFTEAGSVTLQVRELEGKILFSVIDTGIGIAPEHIEQLFIRFEQLDQSHTRRFEGTGLGLAISQSLALLMGGKLLVESQVGVGSTFTLELPYQPTEIEDSESKKASNLRLVGNKCFRGKVLLAEDTSMIRMLVKKILKSLGSNIEIETVDNGRDALNKIKAGNYELVLMDMQMPVMDGIEATQLIRKMGNNIPVVALTANILPSHREEFFAAGCDDFLEKPLKKDKLIDVLQRYLILDSSACA